MLIFNFCIFVKDSIKKKLIWKCLFRFYTTQIQTLFFGYIEKQLIYIQVILRLCLTNYNNIDTKHKIIIFNYYYVVIAVILVNVE